MSLISRITEDVVDEFSQNFGERNSQLDLGNLHPDLDPVFWIDSFGVAPMVPTVHHKLC